LDKDHPCLTLHSVVGIFPIKSNHALNQSPLDVAIAAMEGAATRFSIDAINDANVRTSYMSNIARVSRQAKLDVKAGKISSLEAVEYCYEMRNKIMAEHRKFTSVQGLAKAEQLKKTPPSQAQLFDKYAQKKFKLNYERLNQNQKGQIHYEIIESSGRNNATVSKGTQRMRVMGKVGILVTATIATYEILNADNKVKESARQGIIIGGGVAGGFLAGLGVSALCGPGAPICALAVILVGGAVGGAAGGFAADALDDELEEFSHWEIF
jgi:hypothetical protein